MLKQFNLKQLFNHMTDKAKNRYLSGLYYYPLKSCKGVHCEYLKVGTKGPEMDRRWMIIDQNDRLLSQSDCPKLSLIQAEPTKDSLVVFFPNHEKYKVTIQQSGILKRVKVWKDSCLCLDQGDEIAEILSQFLKKSCRLVFMPDYIARKIPTKADTPYSGISFADRYPFLLVSESSLIDLNQRLENKIPVDRFRPNLVVCGFKPYEEESWKRIQIGEVRFEVARSCSRCTVINIDQSSGIKSDEPLKTLSKYRKMKGGIMFGRYLIQQGTGTIRKGDPLVVLE